MMKKRKRFDEEGAEANCGGEYREEEGRAMAGERGARKKSGMKVAWNDMGRVGRD